MFEKALEIQPGHRPTLEALVDIYTQAGDWEAVIRQKRALLDAHRGRRREDRVSEEIIDIYKEKLQNPQKAIAAYLEALDSSPTITSCCTTCWISSPRPSSGRRRSRSCCGSPGWTAEGQGART